MQPTLGDLISSTIITTALIANRLSVALKGEFIIPEDDYARLVPEFQRRLSRAIVPPKTKAELTAKVDEFVNELIVAMKENQDESSGDDAKTSNDPGRSGDTGDKDSGT